MKRHLGLFSLLEQGGLEPQRLFCKHRVRRGCTQGTKCPTWVISWKERWRLTWCCMDDPRTAPVRCSMVFPQLSKLYSCSRGSLKYQSPQFSHGPVNESKICFAISGLDGGSGSGGHTASPILFGQIDEQPDEELLLSTTYIYSLTSSSSRCCPDLALESTRSKSVPPAAYSIAITLNMHTAHNMACCRCTGIHSPWLCPAGSFHNTQSHLDGSAWPAL